MKVFRKILYVIAGILVLFTILIIACAYNPAITEKIQSVVVKDKKVSVEEADKEGSEDISDTVVSEDGSKSAEQTGEEEYRMRSIEELGISEDSMINDIDTYYMNCHDQIVEHGLGEYSFENVIATEGLIQEIYAKYSNKEYVDKYMNDTLNEIGAATYEMNLLVEELVDNHYRLTHQVVFKGVGEE